MQPDLLIQIREGGILYILLVIAVTMHEYGHAYVADKLGDPLPKLEGRVTVNPLAHMDMMGTVILPILTIALSIGSNFPLVFGWGKPVRVLLDNPKTCKKVDLLSTAGGVGMNLLLALLFSILAAVFFKLGFGDFVQVAIQGIMLNCALFVINMIPVPPLDGSHFLKYAVGMSDTAYFKLSQWGTFILLGIILIPQTKAILLMIMELVSTPFLMLANIIINII